MNVSILFGLWCLACNIQLHTFCQDVVCLYSFALDNLQYKSVTYIKVSQDANINHTARMVQFYYRAPELHTLLN